MWMSWDQLNSCLWKAETLWCLPFAVPLSLNTRNAAEPKACGSLASWSTISCEDISSNPTSPWAMNSRRTAALAPWMFQSLPHVGNAREQLLGQPLKRMGQPIHPSALHRKTWLTQPTAALLRQVGSCHLQTTAAPPHAASSDFCDLGCLQHVVLCKKCSQRLAPPTTRHGDTVLGRRPAPGQHAQGHSHHFRRWRSLF